MTTDASSPELFDDYIKRDMARRSQMMKDANVRPMD